MKVSQGSLEVSGGWIHTTCMTLYRKRKPSTGRQKKAAHMYVDGKTYADVGRELGNIGKLGGAVLLGSDGPEPQTLGAVPRPAAAVA